MHPTSLTDLCNLGTFHVKHPGCDAFSSLTHKRSEWGPSQASVGRTALSPDIQPNRESRLGLCSASTHVSRETSRRARILMRSRRRCSAQQLRSNLPVPTTVTLIRNDRRQRGSVAPLPIPPRLCNAIRSRTRTDSMYRKGYRALPTGPRGSPGIHRLCGYTECPLAPQCMGLSL